MEITIDHTPELLSPPRPNLYPSGQSVLLLEATCVDDEVYDAVRVSDDHGWSRRTQKYIMLGLVSIGFLATAAITGVAVVSMGSQNVGTFNGDREHFNDNLPDPCGFQVALVKVNSEILNISEQRAAVADMRERFKCLYNSYAAELSVAADPQINETIPSNTTRPENGTTSVMEVWTNTVRENLTAC